MLLFKPPLFTRLVVALVAATGCFTLPMHKFEGRVVDRQHQPVSRVAVSITDGPGTFFDLATLTDTGGRFTLHNLTPGQYTLTLAPFDGEVVQRTVTVGRDTAVVELLLE